MLLFFVTPHVMRMLNNQSINMRMINLNIYDILKNKKTDVEEDSSHLAQARKGGIENQGRSWTGKNFPVML